MTHPPGRAGSLARSAVIHVADTVILALAAVGVFCIGWLVVAALMREERAAALCFALYSALEAAALYDVAASLHASGSPRTLSVSLAILSGGVADIGADYFINRRPRYLRVWISIIVAGIALQQVAPFLPHALQWRQVGYALFLLILLGAPLVAFYRPLVGEFGRLGALALLPFGVFTVYIALYMVHLLLLGGAIDKEVHGHATGSLEALLPTVLSSSFFHLTWLAVVVGRQVATARRFARLDALTGTLQRAALEAEMDSALAMARRHGHPVCVAFVDVDHFKMFNDLGGHSAGDSILKQLASTLLRTMRQSDHIGRWGGEEFLVLMPATDDTGARRLLDRLQSAVRSSGITVPLGCEPVSVSVGFAVWNATEAGWDGVVARADAAMYEAKRRGRDRTVGACEREPEPVPHRLTAAF